jgi:hypothetical protein
MSLTNRIRRKIILGCLGPKCKRTFHFPCGLKNGTGHQYRYTVIHDKNMLQRWLYTGTVVCTGTQSFLRIIGIHLSSVVDPKLFITVPDPTFQ